MIDDQRSDFVAYTVFFSLASTHLEDGRFFNRYKFDWIDVSRVEVRAFGRICVKFSNNILMIGCVHKPERWVLYIVNLIITF